MPKKPSLDYLRSRFPQDVSATVKSQKSPTYTVVRSSRAINSSVDKVKNVSDVSGITIDIKATKRVFITLTQDVNIHFTNMPLTSESVVISISLIQDAVGGHLVFYPSGIYWENGLLPDLSKAPNARNDLTFDFSNKENTTIITGYLIAIMLQVV